MPEISLVMNITSLLYGQDTLDCMCYMNMLLITRVLFTVFSSCGYLKTSGSGSNLSTAGEWPSLRVQEGDYLLDEELFELGN